MKLIENVICYEIHVTGPFSQKRRGKKKKRKKDQTFPMNQKVKKKNFFDF